LSLELTCFCTCGLHLFIYCIGRNEIVNSAQVESTPFLVLLFSCVSMCFVDGYQLMKFAICAIGGCNCCIKARNFRIVYFHLLHNFSTNDAKQYLVPWRDM